jgi:hypothetical protein
LRTWLPDGVTGEPAFVELFAEWCVIGAGFELAVEELLAESSPLLGNGMC